MRTYAFIGIMLVDTLVQAQMSLPSPYNQENCMAGKEQVFHIFPTFAA